jgi:hypothetical protein
VDIFSFPFRLSFTYAHLQTIQINTTTFSFSVNVEFCKPMAYAPVYKFRCKADFLTQKFCCCLGMNTACECVHLYLVITFEGVFHCVRRWRNEYCLKSRGRLMMGKLYNECALFVRYSSLIRIQRLWRRSLKNSSKPFVFLISRLRFMFRTDINGVLCPSRRDLRAWTKSLSRDLHIYRLYCREKVCNKSIVSNGC